MGNEDMADVALFEVSEVVILSKFNGDSTDPQDEVERVTVDNGLVVNHDVIIDGEIAGPVEDSEILGKDIGRLYPETAEGV